jgi:histidine racemase
MVSSTDSPELPQDQSRLEFLVITDLESDSAPTLAGAVALYRNAFAESPYNEKFTECEVRSALQLILDQAGDLLLGWLRGQVVSVAGGCLKDDGAYFIEELAVAPGHQGRGYGRQTLGALLELAAARSLHRLEVRTTTHNLRAISLYESLGFSREETTEAVAHRRVDDRISVDERVYLSRPPAERGASPTRLRRLAVAYPSGNTTALLFDQLQGSDRKLLNDRVMRSWGAAKPESPEIEQCCFVMASSDPDAIGRVEMFGGEFCGNATRSAVWLLTNGQDYNGQIEAAGVRGLLRFSVDGGDITLQMPLPSQAQLLRAVAEGCLVQLDGIVHLVVTDGAVQGAATPRQMLDALLRANKYDLASQPAVGVTFYSYESSRAEFCVWVKEVDTIFDESACGSGTCAIGIAAATSSRESVRLPVVQPSGQVIITNAGYDQAAGQVQSSTISGVVDILYDGGFVLQ